MIQISYQKIDSIFNFHVRECDLSSFKKKKKCMKIFDEINLNDEIFHLFSHVKIIDLERKVCPNLQTMITVA